jgi:two-component system CheB/CheR fusion protein
MPVREVTNNLRVEENHVYVIPPNTNLGVAQGVLKLRPRQQTRTPTRSIDLFLESLAQDRRERAIGVILSGTATDGTLGLEAIKAEGGITFAQDDSARYDSMPRSAIAAGCVDFVLKPEDIAKELARIANHPYVAGQPHEISPEDDRAAATAHEDDETPLPSGGHGTPGTGAKGGRGKAERADVKGGENGFKKILLLLRNHCGVDFSLYKSTTIQRRITRRMVLSKQDAPEGYASFLRGNAKELDALYSDVLISVTSFFRNPDAFDILKRKVFPSSFSSAATTRSASGCSAVPPARKRIPSRWRSWNQRRMLRTHANSRCLPPTSTRRCWTKPGPAFTPRASRRISHGNGCGDFLSRKKPATGSSNRSARWLSSPGKISSATRRSRAWTSSVAAIC